MTRRSRRSRTTPPTCITKQTSARCTPRLPTAGWELIRQDYSVATFAKPVSASSESSAQVSNREEPISSKILCACRALCGSIIERHATYQAHKIQAGAGTAPRDVLLAEVDP